MSIEASFDHVALARESGFVEPSTTADPAPRASAQQCRAQRSRRRGVGNAHFAEDHQVVTG